MTWSPETSCGREQDKIAAHVVQYMVGHSLDLKDGFIRGRILDLGCGLGKVWPGVIGVDSGQAFGMNTAAEINTDISDLSLFADGSCDAVFSSHALEDFPRSKVPSVLAEWSRVLRPDGHLILYVPSANLYPKVGEKGANPAHQWNIYPGDIAKILKECTDCGWMQLEAEERSGTNEYSLFEVYRKRTDGQFIENIWQRNPEGKKRALIIRYGAIGDAIMASSILAGLKDQGYHITYNTTPDAQNIIRHDPNVDEWLLQEKDFVPNNQLGPYWEQLSERYDKVINLCESLEGKLLFLPDRLESKYPHGLRNKLCDRNYLEFTHDIAEVPHDFNPRFYMSQFEHNWAYTERQKINAPVVMIALTGSAVHKTYPWVNVITAWLMQKTPCHVFLCADPASGKQLQDAIIECVKRDGYDTSRIHPMAGKWRIRECLSFAQFCDVVVGPETGTLNAVSFEQDIAKVVFLSHSSQENLTKHWVNTISLEPEASKCPCFPCHTLHYGWDRCNKDEQTGAALCASSISPERVFEAIIHSLKMRKAA